MDAQLSSKSFFIVVPQRRCVSLSQAVPGKCSSSPSTAARNPLWINETRGVERIARLVLFVEPKLRSVRSQKNVDFHRLLVGEALRIIRGDPWIRRHPAHPDSGIDRPQIHNRHLIGPASLRHVQRKACCAFGMAGMVVRRDRRPAQRNPIRLSGPPEPARNACPPGSPTGSPPSRPIPPRPHPVPGLPVARRSSRFSSAIPATWSKWDWIARQDFNVQHLKTSFSTFALISGTVEASPVLIRMSPCGVVTR